MNERADSTSLPHGAPAGHSARIRVPLRHAPHADYDVVMEPGVLSRLAPLLREIAPAPHYVVISDANVAALHGEAVLAAVRAQDVAVDLLGFPAGERSKTREQWAELSDALLARGLGRDGCILALGGGVTTDLAGFIAATYMRGIACVQLPTSLLAMIDASVGGKTGVDVTAGKNLIGAFAHPRLVAIDPLVLRTLPDAELRAGLAEAVKHGAIADASYFEQIERDTAPLLARAVPALARLIRRSVEIKADVVARDPVEAGERATLNFGHTVAHAIERAAAYAIRHGFAVAIGMVAEAELGEALGVTRAGTAARLRGVLDSLGLPTTMPAALSVDQVVAATGTDKKARANRLRFALLADIGQIARDRDGAWTFAATPREAASALARTRPR